MPSITAVLRGPNGETPPESFLVDTGASKTLIPQSLAQQLGIVAHGEESVDTADASSSMMPVADVQVEIPGEAPVFTKAYLTKGRVLALGTPALREMGFKLEGPDGENVALVAADSGEDPLIDQMAADRMFVCQAGCPKYTELPVVGPMCTKCACLLTRKVRSVAAVCPMKKW